MGGTIRARFKHGRLELLDRIELPEGKEVTITVMDISANTNLEAFLRSAGSWKGHVDADNLIRNIYADRLVPARRSKPRL